MTTVPLNNRWADTTIVKRPRYIDPCGFFRSEVTFVRQRGGFQQTTHNTTLHWYLECVQLNKILLPSKSVSVPCNRPERIIYSCFMTAQSTLKWLGWASADLTPVIKLCANSAKKCPNCSRSRSTCPTSTRTTISLSHQQQALTFKVHMSAEVVVCLL